MRGLDPSFDASTRTLRFRASTLAAFRVMLSADRRQVMVLSSVAVVQGILPMVVALAGGRLVRSAQQLEGAGLSSPAGHRLLGALAVVALSFILAEALLQITSAYIESFRFKVQREVQRRMIRATTEVPGIAHLEDPQILDLIRLATKLDWPDVSAFGGSVFFLIAQWLSGALALVILAGFNPTAATGLGLLWIVVGSRVRRRQAAGFFDARAPLRQADYLRSIAFEHIAAKEVRVFGIAGWLLDGYTARFGEVMREVWRQRLVSRFETGAMFVVIAGAHLAAFSWMATEAGRGSLGAAELAVLAPAVLSAVRLGWTNEHTLNISLGANTLPAVEAVEDEVATNPRCALGGSLPADGRPFQEVRFEGVRFGYPGRDTSVYHALDLTIEAGRSLAIVGANGSGKTTLVKLLARLYDVDGGRITVDGIDVRDFAPQAWQRRVAAIFQDFVRYELSAADNIGFGSIEHLHDEDRLRSALARVGALDLVEALPEGLETVLSRRFEGGMDLSGGQWQRLALARALMAVEGGAGILVLDEPTANLDVRAEVELFNRFLEVTKGSTTILISHRFSTVRRADRIVVLEAGRVVEDGTHDSLVEAGGHYATSFQLQASRYTDLSDPFLDEDEPEQASA
ncbi:MAG TPA: ABC transporter ATP-binding protein [Acidimicrobiales bacterium]|nr:ABC transporter ATP-binding protein [Acidimicrobiales bacterium]